VALRRGPARRRGHRPRRPLELARDVVSLQRAVLRASALSVVLADAVKFGRRAAEFLGRASAVDRILTDASSSEFEAAGLRPGQRLDITKGGTKP
jgi:DeoR/GlpR family transcriptional regulator of sugar metabolism